MRHSPTRYLWALVFLLAIVIWTVQIGRPVDLPNWHESDYSSIARNFLREGNNILYPRIDWRGDGPGFTEMEFPIIPWTMGQLYHVFGTKEIIGRLLSCLFTLLSLGVFSRIALKVLPEAGAIVAALFFVVAHVVTQIATAIQPEALMLLFYLLAIYYFLDWYETQRKTAYFFAIASFACAMLVKSPAAQLAIFFLLWALHKDGMKAFRRPSLYLFAILSFAPVILWYAHAASLWHQFHNSMGVSNEDHWLGLDIFRRPKVIANLLSIDVLLVCGAGGAIVALVAVMKDRMRSPVNRLAIYWSIAVVIYLVVIIRTAGAYWATYYHVIVVPPIALLFAAGITELQLAKRTVTWRQLLLWCGLAAVFSTAVLLLLGRRDLARLPGVFQDLLVAQSSMSTLVVLSVLSFLVTVLSVRLKLSANSPPAIESSNWNTPLIITGCFIYFLLSGQMLLGTWKNFGTRTPQFISAECIRKEIAPNSLIVASGGICFDPGGHRVANAAPQMFYWLDRKGFTTCQGHESVPDLKAMAERGAKYFVADKSSFEIQPGLESELRHSFPLIVDCNAALLFSLQTR